MVHMELSWLVLFDRYDVKNILLLHLILRCNYVD